MSQNTAPPPPTADLKVLNSKANIDENFVNYFLKPNLTTKFLKVLKCTCKGHRKA